MRYVTKTDLEINTLAYDVFCGKVFGSWMIEPEDNHRVSEIFTPLSRLDREALLNLKHQRITHVYTYITSVQDLHCKHPLFFSLHYLDRLDCHRLSELIQPLIEDYHDLLIIDRHFFDYI